MKKKNLKKFIKDNIMDISIIIVSIIAFIVGVFSIGFIKSFGIIFIIDLLIFVPAFIKNRKKIKIHKHKEIKNSTKNSTNLKTNKVKKKKKKKFLNIFLILFMSLCIIIILAVIAFMLYISSTAPKFNPENLYQKESTIVYDKDGKEKAKLGLQKRESIKYDDLPQILVDAIIATEDSNYFNHKGVDWSRFFVASLKQVLRRGGGGASTITMQISKNAFTSKEDEGIKGIIRKFTDIYVSTNEIEPNYTKEEILEFYVNSYYLGGGAYGVEQASQNYFGKSVSDINISEAAMLAGLFKGGYAYDPTKNPERAEARRIVVLKLMLRHGYITQEEYDIASKMNVTTLLSKGTSSGESDAYDDFIDTVVREVRNDTGNDPYSVPMLIYTTMDSAKQEHVNRIMKGEGGFSWPNDNTQAGIAVVDVKTGGISAIGGSRSRTGELELNRATQIKEQIGSTAKPLYDYAPAIEYNNSSTYSLLVDEPYSYSDGNSINNWDMSYYGLITSRTALATSRNIPALKTFQSVKKSDITKMVTSLGLHPEEADGSLHEAHSIGGYNGENPLSMAAAYASFGNGGVYNSPHSYTKIVYRESNKTIEKQITTNQAMSAETAYMVYDMLKSAATYGLGSTYSVNGVTYAAKTGTTNFTQETKQQKHLPANAINDYWVNGVNPDYAISVWLGYDDIDKGYNVSGTIYHRLLFRAVAQGVFTQNKELPRPSGVVTVQVEMGTNPAQKASQYTPQNLIATELFKSGTEPTETSTRFSQLSNVTDLKSTISDNILTLHWTPIETPEWLDETFLNNYFDKLYSDAGTKANAKAERNAYNKNNIGDVVYKIYSKNSNGELKLLGTTKNNQYEINLTSESEKTYVVKTSYTIFTANMSSGVSTTISLDNVKDNLSFSLVGENTVTINNGSYTEKGVKVTNNGTDVTSKAKVNIVYKNSSNKEVKVTDITSTNPDVYNASYTITYNGTAKTLTRTIITTQ